MRVKRKMAYTGTRVSPKANEMRNWRPTHARLLINRDCYESSNDITYRRCQSRYDTMRRLVYYLSSMTRRRAATVKQCVTAAVRYTLCLEKKHLFFGHNLDKHRPILKILSLTGSHGNFVHDRYQQFPPHQSVLLHYLVELENLKLGLAN